MADDKTFTVSIVFETTSGKDPLSVAKLIAKWLKEDADTFIYDVVDDQTNEKFTVDLSEDDEDAVLPNKD